MSSSTFTFANQDHTVGAILCDYLDKDTRVRASGYVIRDTNLILQVDADNAAECVQESLARVLEDIRALRRSVSS